MEEKLEYKAPLVRIRGVVLCENLADTVAVSAVTGGITQDGWGADTVMGEEATDSGGDVWLRY
jgi:hypothetical protein